MKHNFVMFLNYRTKLEKSVDDLHALYYVTNSGWDQKQAKQQFSEDAFVFQEVPYGFNLV